MSDYDRGPYASSSEPPLAFDPRRPVRGAGPVPATLIISVLILAGLVGGVAFIYRGGIRHGSGAPGQVGAPLGDIKAPAPAQTPDNAATAGLTIYKTGAPPVADNQAAPTFAASPEQPRPRPGETGAAPAAAPPAAAAAGPPSPPLPPTAKAAKPAAQPSAIASLADAAANRPATKAMAGKPAKPADQAAAPPTGAGWVQIGAFSSTALAEKGWSDIARFAPAAMAGKGKNVEPVAKGGGTVYRTYITGFASKAAATSFCDKLKAAGKSCFVK
jgi:hypothetical protein